MIYDLIPPAKDFFSYGWYERDDGFGMRMMTDDLYSRIDSTRRKLSELEAKLQRRLDSDRYNPDLRSFCERVRWLRGYIGIWSCRDQYDAIGWDVQMAYPHTKQIISVWPENLFGERKGGNILILLSPSTVHWLNRVDKWASTVDSTTTYDYAST